MRMLKMLFSFIPKFSNYFIIIGVVIFTAFSNFITYKLMKAHYVVERNTYLIKEKAELAKLQKYSNEQDKAILALQANLNKKQEVITKEVIKYVSKPEHVSCTFDTDWLRIVNESVKSSNSASTTEFVGPTMPATGNTKKH